MEAKKLEALKVEVIAEVEKNKDLVQQMVDQIFSYGELGFQEVETSKYLVGLLKQNGFAVQEGVSGIPTAWFARWGSGKPVISLGTDIDGIPKSSQKPGVAYPAPLVEGAPGHGEGHNSGMAVNIVAAIAVKKLMERDKIPGTIVIWPGVAEELVGTKAIYVRDGFFKDVDITLFSHVDSEMKANWGTQGHNALVSVRYDFTGTAAHSAGSPWRGKSALDAVELMNAGWNYRREHLKYTQRSHYVIPDGGDQPNVVPSKASVWYYFRETDYKNTKDLWDIGNRVAQGAAMMTDTMFTSTVLGSAMDNHMSKPVAEAMSMNMKRVGMPAWDENDQTLAKAVQKELSVKEAGLSTKVSDLEGPVDDKARTGGGSDDIGDVQWNTPSVTLRFPANIPNLPGHSFWNAIAMATPIAHKGATAGAKVMATTMLDLFAKPQLVADSWKYFNEVQTKDRKYVSFLSPTDKPAIHLNEGIAERFREKMRPYYYDSTKYKTYLEQLGIKYPTIRTAPAEAAK
ncbi:MAG: amidohydrolase [Vicinamibacteria bacterium]|nr:amidohydrolase [Vicinamibacteria bacterium]